MFSQLKESIIFTFKVAGVFFKFFWLGIVAISGWLKEFPLINKWYYSFLLPKALIVIVGLLVTSIPLWLLIPLSFVPLPIIAPIFFVAFIFALAHF